MIRRLIRGSLSRLDHFGGRFIAFLARASRHLKESQCPGTEHRAGSCAIKDACGATVTAEEMRAKALECEEKSQTGTAELRNLYSVLAREWRRMADLIESAAEERP